MTSLGCAPCLRARSTSSWPGRSPGSASRATSRTSSVERARIERWHATLDRALPTRLVPRFDKRFSVVVEETGGFPTYVISPRGPEPERTVLFVHGGAFMAPIDPFHIRYAVRLATSLRARIVLPDYPLAPEHSWRDSFEPMTDLAERWCKEPGGAVLYGDSAGGGYALALAMALRDRGGPQPTSCCSTHPGSTCRRAPRRRSRWPRSTRGCSSASSMRTPSGGPGSPEDLARPEVSPALGDLSGLPPALMFCGTRDLLVPGCRLLASRAAEAGWPLTYVEVPDLIHVYALLPFVPEARRAWRQTLGYLR